MTREGRNGIPTVLFLFMQSKVAKSMDICNNSAEEHMKYKEPVKGKGFRELFRKNGYELYLGDEHKTSCRCSICEGECETFRICENPRPWREGTITRHGLVRCKTCKVLWNRDENSSCNIFKVVEYAINKKKRPKYLCRINEKHLSLVTSTVAQPKITRG